MTQTQQTNEQKRQEQIRQRIAERQARLDNPELWGLTPEVPPQHISKALAYKYEQSLRDLFHDSLTQGDNDIYDIACNMEGAMCYLETYYGNDVNLW